MIARSRLRALWSALDGDAGIAAEKALSNWHRTAELATWTCWADVRQTSGSADAVGSCVVWNVAGNKLRVIGRINYARGILYVLAILTHAEYDRARWVDDCGCFSPPPPPAPTKPGPSPAGKRRKPEREQ